MAGSENKQINNGSTSEEPQTNALQIINHGCMVDQGVRYGECRRNHAASMGLYATDGCGEFLHSRNEGNNDPLLCAACGCHRNFHRKELPTDHLFNHLASIHIPQLLPPPTSTLLPQSDGLVGVEGPLPLNQRKSDLESEEKRRLEMEVRRKRRSKFTEEQKNEMLRFAEKLGWRPQRHDEEEIEKFCTAIGISRRVFKVWLTNNKHKKDGE